MTKAMFKTVKEFAVFNSKPHVFSYSSPYQIFSFGANQEVFINLESGCEKLFSKRVEQFGGILIG